jgi:hypothetical protein
MLNTITPSDIGRDYLPTTTPANDQVETTLARSMDELMAAFHLLYNAYVRAGFVAENDKEIRVTPYHALATTEVFVAKCRTDVISTMTMVGDGALGLPMESMYGDQIAALRRSGLNVAEMGSFADRRESPARFLDVFGKLATLVVQVARTRNIDGLVAATHPKHARFYCRWLGFRVIGDLADCPYAAGNPAVALLLDFDEVRARNPAAHDRLFGQPVAEEQLRPTVWPQHTRDTIGQLVITETKPGTDTVKSRGTAVKG